MAGETELILGNGCIVLCAVKVLGKGDEFCCFGEELV